MDYDCVQIETVYYNISYLFLLFLFQFPITALREIRILQLLKHDNVVNLLEICQTRGSRIGRLNYIILYIFIYFFHDINAM